MKISRNIVPVIFRGEYINRVKSQAIYTMAYTISTYGNGYTKNNAFIVYNIVKKRAKRVRGKDGSYKKVERAEVVLYRYTISFELLKVLGLKVIQKQRNFRLVKA